MEGVTDGENEGDDCYEVICVGWGEPGGEWTQWRWRSEEGSWFHRWGDAYLKERLVTCNEEDTFYIIFIFGLWILMKSAEHNCISVVCASSIFFFAVHPSRRHTPPPTTSTQLILDACDSPFWSGSSFPPPTGNERERERETEGPGPGNHWPVVLAAADSRSLSLSWLAAAGSGYEV